MGAPDFAIASAFVGPLTLDESIRQAREAAAVGVPGAGSLHFRLLGFASRDKRKPTAWESLPIEKRARIAAAVGSHALARMHWCDMSQAERSAIKQVCWREAQAMLAVCRVGVFA